MIDWATIGVFIAFVVGITGGAYAIGRTSGKVDAAVEKIGELGASIKELAEHLDSQFARKESTLLRINGLEQQVRTLQRDHAQTEHERK